VLQIIVLVYMGAASGSWNPGVLVSRGGDPHSRGWTKHGTSLGRGYYNEVELIDRGCSGEFPDYTHCFCLFEIDLRRAVYDQ
jgi:hypothetical protein